LRQNKNTRLPCPVSTMPRPSRAIRKDKLVRTAAFQASRY